MSRGASAVIGMGMWGDVQHASISFGGFIDRIVHAICVNDRVNCIKSCSVSTELGIWVILHDQNSEENLKCAPN